MLEKQERMEQRYTDFVLEHVASNPSFPDRWLSLEGKLPKRKKEYTGHARAEKNKLDEERRAMARDFFTAFVADQKALVALWGKEELGAMLRRTAQSTEEALVKAQKQATQAKVEPAVYATQLAEAQAWMREFPAKAIETYDAKCVAALPWPVGPHDVPMSSSPHARPAPRRRGCN